MSLVDDRGRVFGRINLVDASVLMVLLILIPVGYGTYLLFRPVSAPRIDEVTQAEVTRDSVSIGGRVAARFKVRGNGFTPLLRARIGDVDALSFVFESPNSADLWVGPIAPGPHDLVLLDGRQEVARAQDAIVINETVSGAAVRAVGWLIDLHEESVREIGVGTALPAAAPAYRVMGLGQLIDGYKLLTLAGSTIQIPVPGTKARRATVWLSCDATAAVNPCLMSQRPELRQPPVVISLAGPSRPFVLAIDEILPATPPTMATLRVRLSPGSPAAGPGERDLLLDERAAVVSSVNGDTITVEAGLDRQREDWVYRGRRVVPGAPFTLATDRYEARGIVQSVDLKASTR